MSIIVTDAGFAPAPERQIGPLAELTAEATAVDLAQTDDPSALEGHLDRLTLIRVAFPAFSDGRAFTVVDTGGWLPGGSDLDEKVSRQVEAAVRHADVVLFLVESYIPLSPPIKVVIRVVVVIFVCLWLLRVFGIADIPIR